MKIKFLLGVLCLLASSARARDANLERFVRACHRVLRWAAGIRQADTDKETEQIAREYRAAQRFLASVPARQRPRLLLEAQRLPLAAGARQGVAYIAALNGIEPLRNARRMLEFDGSARPKGLFGDLPETAENIFDNLVSVYHRTHNTGVARLLLEEGSDGGDAVVAQAVRFQMLRQEPRRILRLAMQSKRAFSLLTRDFESEGDERGFRAEPRP